MVLFHEVVIDLNLNIVPGLYFKNVLTSVYVTFASWEAK